MRLLFIGDVVGKPGRDIITQALPGLIVRDKIDLVVANAENAAAGSGITPNIYKELMKSGIDAITLGDHIYRRKEIYSVLEEKDNIVKPANLPKEAVGKEWCVVTARNNTQVAVFCLLGRIFMKPIDNPWRAADRILPKIPDEIVVRFCDFHVEATSEAQTMGYHLDGRVSAVLGTHTHVPTADECILPGGTAFQCDVGMTGPYKSILGRRIDRVLETTLTSRPTQFDVAAEDLRICGSYVEINDRTGKATSIERLCIREEEAVELERQASQL